MKAVILAGGRGSRLNEFTKDKNKSMLKLFEKPLIQYNLDHAIEAHVKEIIIVVGYKKEEIMRFIGKEYKGTKVSYVIQKQQKGLVHAIECAKQAIGDSDFFLMLGDEILINARIKKLIKKFRKEELYILCGSTIESNKSSISKTYSAMIDQVTGRVFRLIEKPKFPINNIKGTGHCIMKNDILRYISKTPISMQRGERELVDMIQLAVDEGKKVKIEKITDNYVNINNEEDLRLAEDLMKKQSPKVLLVHTQMKFLGGAELLIVELANWLTKRGIKNDIFALSSSREVQDRLINTEIIIPKHNIDLKPPGFKNTKDILDFVKIYRRELKKLIADYDVINFHNFPATWSLWPKKKPSVWMLNEPPNLWSKPDASFVLRIMNKFRNWLDKRIVKNINIICVADEFNRQRCRERYRKDARIVYYGVNYDFFSKGNAKRAVERWNLKNKFIIVQSGMITETKKQLESIKTITTIKDKIPNLLLVFAGKIADEEYKKKIDDYIKKNKLEKHILFTGNLDRTSLRDLYKAGYLGIYPVGGQGGWLAPFEHLCSGNPVIVSEDLGAASVIKRFALGIVTNDYARAILEIYENLQEYKSDGNRRLQIIKKNLGWDVFADKLIKAFRDAWLARSYS